MASACRCGAVTWMATAVVGAIEVGFLCFVMAVIVTAILAFRLDMFLCLYVRHQKVVGVGVEGKKKKKEKKEKSRVGVVEALVEGEEGGVVDFVGEESVDGGLVVKGVDLVQTEYFDGGLVVEGGDLKQTECSDDSVVMNGGDLEQTECSNDSLVVNGGDLEPTECADSLVVEGGDLAQTEYSDGKLVVQGGHCEQTECSDGKDVVFGDGAADGGCGVEDGEDDDEILPSQGEDDDDEWVRIEKSGLGERFGCLASFMASEAGEALLGTVGSDVRLRLYALHKVAVEGPCYKLPALVLTSSARTEWYKLYFVSLYSVL